MDLLSDLAIPDITSAQLAPVKPDLNAGRAERLANSPPRLSILCGVAQDGAAVGRSVEATARNSLVLSGA
jgi:hypothetical protein